VCTAGAGPHCPQVSTDAPRTELAITATSSILLLDSDTTRLLGTYIRVDDEIMFVIKVGGPTTAVKSVSVYRSDGGPACSCSITGTASGGESCTCTGDRGTNCTASGSLKIKDGNVGAGFAATFIVSGGHIEGITVTNPGEGYDTLSSADVIMSTGGQWNNLHPCIVSWYPTVSQQYVVVSRAQLGTKAAAHALGSKVAPVIADNPPATAFAAYSTSSQGLFTFGGLQQGESTNEPTNDIWKMSLTTGGWSRVLPDRVMSKHSFPMEVKNYERWDPAKTSTSKYDPNVKPPKRQQAAAALVGSLAGMAEPLLVIGGSGEQGLLLDDIWMIDTQEANTRDGPRDGMLDFDGERKRERERERNNVCVCVCIYIRIYVFIYQIHQACKLFIGATTYDV